MGCGCKKREPVVIEPKPKTPDELLSQELNDWNGGVQISGQTENNG